MEEVRKTPRSLESGARGIAVRRTAKLIHLWRVFLPAAEDTPEPGFWEQKSGHQ